MKKQGYNVELVTEYAKDLVYSESFFKLKDQLMVFGKQHHRLWKLRGKVDYVITDSPLPLSLHYFSDGEPYNKDAFLNLVLSTFNSYKNINIFLVRNTNTYQEYGRTQSELEAIQIDIELKEMLEICQIDYDTLMVSDTISDILDFIKKT